MGRGIVICLRLSLGVDGCSEEIKLNLLLLKETYLERMSHQALGQRDSLRIWYIGCTLAGNDECTPDWTVYASSHELAQVDSYRKLV
jgi:hypothetical protein